MMTVSPLCILSLSFIVGMIAATLLAPAAGCAGLVAITGIVLGIGRIGHKKVSPLVVLIVLFAAVGWGRAELHEWSQQRAQAIRPHFPSGIIRIQAQVETDIRHGPRRDSARIVVQSIWHKGRWVPLKADLQMAFPKEVNLDYGDRIAAWGTMLPFSPLNNAGLMTYEERLLNEGVLGTFLVSPGKIDILERGKGSPIAHLVKAVSRRANSVLQNSLPPDQATLLGSILFGVQSVALPEELQETFRRAGVIHLLVVSGQQVSLLAGMALAAIQSVRIPLQVAIPAASAITFLFGVMVGGGAAIWRAVAMAQFALWARFFERATDWPTTLAAAGMGILMIDPGALINPGFQFSFAATTSLIAVVPIVTEKWSQKIPAWLAQGLALAVVPTLMTVPIAFAHFGELHVSSFLANLAAIPIVELIVPLGFVAVLAGMFWLPAAQILNGTNDILLSLLRLVAEFCAVLGGSAFLTFGGLPGILVGELPLRISVLDVGQGDSVLIQAPSGPTMLIDGGIRRMGKQVILPVLRKKGVRSIDLMVLTHPHEDHMGGLVSALENIPVKTVITSGQIASSESYTRFIQTIRQRKIPMRVARPGMLIHLGPNISARVVGPEFPFLENTQSDLNNNSIAMRLVYREFEMLFTGDTEREGEERLLDSRWRLDSDILKAGHHGSKTSSTDEFLDRVRPKTAIISCGVRNRYHHPHPSTLSKFKQRRIKIYRTDTQGEIHIQTNGRSIHIDTAADTP